MEEDGELIERIACQIRPSHKHPLVQLSPRLFKGSFALSALSGRGKIQARAAGLGSSALSAQEDCKLEGTGQ